MPAAGKARRISRGRRDPQQLTTLEQGAPFVRQVLPQLRVGDPVIIRMLGADGRSFSCASERCPACLLRADGTIESIE